MNETLRGLENCVVYMDDILIHSATAAEHAVHLRAVLERLRTRRFFCKLSKCTFMASRVKYLGHVLSADGLKVDPDKVAAVQDWALPASVSHVRSFLGMTNYFRRWLQGYAALCTPLNALLKKGVPFIWSSACAAAFEGLKWALGNAPVLVLPDFGTDATTFGAATGRADMSTPSPIAAW